MPKPKTTLVCVLDGCSQTQKAKGLCQSHYWVQRQRERRHEIKAANQTIYARDIDFDDYWLFVKKELGIK